MNKYVIFYTKNRRNTDRILNGKKNNMKSYNRLKEMVCEICK